MPLLSASQLAAVQNVGLLAMTTTVVIKRQAESTDVYEDVDPSVDPATVTEVLGWLQSTPTPTADIGDGAIRTSNTYSLLLPVGTDILPRDIAVIDDIEYVVTDTTAGDTWPDMLRASLRLVE